MDPPTSSVIRCQILVDLAATVHLPLSALSIKFIRSGELLKCTPIIGSTRLSKVGDVSNFGPSVHVSPCGSGELPLLHGILLHEHSHDEAATPDIIKLGTCTSCTLIVTFSPLIVRVFLLCRHLFLTLCTESHGRARTSSRPASGRLHNIRRETTSLRRPWKLPMVSFRISLYTEKDIEMGVLLLRKSPPTNDASTTHITYTHTQPFRRLKLQHNHFRPRKSMERNADP
ncbi:hypothetical protein V8F20_006323 [Naviculisporaceae sp. PSN 640]